MRSFRIIVTGLALSGCAAAVDPCEPPAHDAATGFSETGPCVFVHSMNEWDACLLEDGTMWKVYADGSVTHSYPVQPVHVAHYQEGQVICVGTTQ